MRDKRKAFIRLAEQRTNKVLKALDILGHCSNPQLYEYTAEDIERISTAIQKRLEFVKTKFEGRTFHL